ncbi:WD repeat-containing protein 91 [Onthophagus taurus]|uniref:WD repeat-containing protein 91 n=1 Tax=Onthophagus taurus TaxID=166361 RepID=UPI0039BE1AB1
MAHVQYMDELIKEYLLYRGFTATVKAFDNDLKADKEKGFRVDKITDHIVHLINNYDLNSLRDLWAHLDNHMFSKLESNFIPGVKKLENAVLKMYLVNTIVNNKPEKVTEFFSKMTSELQSREEWKEWFVLPYIKNPEENPTFSLYFTKHWQDILLVSLHNFLASVFQYMPTPTLMSFEEDANKINKLEAKNDSLKKTLALLIDKGPEAVAPCQVAPPSHDIYDDFYTIAQENNAVENQAKSLKNLIRNISSGSSPILGRKDVHGGKKRLGSISGKSGKSQTSQFET